MKYHKFLTRMSGSVLALLMTVSSVPADMLCVHAESDSFIAGDVLFDDVSGIVADATLEEGALDPEIVNIPVAAGNEIDQDAVANESYAGELSDSYGSHDWSAYISDTLPSRLSSSERAMYDACDDLLLAYLNNSNVDATKYTTSSYSYYVTSSIDFASFGLNKQQAFAVAQLFLYNNPQYYFASSVFLTTSSKIWFTIYNQFADGDARARYTDSVFTELDKWIVSCSDYETTTYMKEVSAHQKICNAVSYISGTYDQSIYSVLMENRTVCAGYAEVFTMMMNAMGVDTMTVLSNCHAWNVIQLDDGKYYCVDATWNDSLGGRYLFNVSESNLKKYDTSANEHKISADWSTGWVPSMSGSDYVPTYYDTTGFEGNGSVALSAPDNLSGKYDSSSDTIRIDWTEVAGASGYEVKVYDNSNNSSIGSARIVVNHIRVASVAGRDMLVKIRAVGVNDGQTCYSDWSQITYIDGKFAAYRDDEEVKLNTPKNFRASIRDDDTFDLSWDAVSNASGYSILLYSDADRQDKLASLNTTAAGVHVSGIAAGTPVYAYIRAFKSISGVTYYSDWAVLTVRTNTVADADTLTLGTPSAASYTKVSSSSGKVSWIPGSNSVSTNVVVLLNSTTGSKVGSLNTSGAAFNLNGLNISKTYYVGLQAVGSDGSVSDWVYLKVGSGSSGSSSSTDSDRTEESTGVAAPDKISYEVISGNSGRITWTAVSNASGYEVQISSGSDFSSLLGKLSMSGTSVKITGMNAANTYYARVRSMGTNNTYSAWTVCKFKPSSESSGSSNNSSGDSGSQSGITAPQNLSVTVVDTKSRLKWDSVAGAVKYTVEIYADSAYTVKAASLTLGGTSVLINGMSSGRTYYVRVNAVDTNGNVSAWSTYKYAKP